MTDDARARRTRRRRRVAAAAAVLLASVFALAARGAEGSGEKPAALRPTAELVGPTDGYAVSLEVSGDLAGSLETCGCPKNPMGGFAWRAGYADALAGATKREVAIVHADAGRAFADALVDGKMADDVRVKNEWMLRSFERLDVPAVNVAASDLVFLAPMTATRGYAAREKRFPALARLVSTNVVPKTPAARAFPASAVRTVKSARLGGAPLRVGFLGVTELPAGAVAKRLEGALKDYEIKDPVEAARAALPDLRATCDVVVVLAYVNRDTAKKLGELGPDLVVAAHQFPLFDKTDAAGTATVAYVSTQTKWLSEVRLSRAGGKVTVAGHRDVPLDAGTPTEPRAQKLVDAARNDFTSVQEEALRREETGTGAAALAAKRAELAEASPFAGSESCAKCHAYQYEIWQTSQHSHAFKTLKDRKRHLDDACTVCHTLAQNAPGGFVDTRLTPKFVNVQCESCHGPGKKHIADPKAEGYGLVDTPAKCVSCHSGENDPDFDFASYWPKIQHDDADAPSRFARTVPR